MTNSSSLPTNFRLLSVIATSVCVASLFFVSNTNLDPISLEDAPKMVQELGDLARRDVENDATNAGLKALSSHGSLAATLTGGLKRDLQNMNEGDDLLLARIEDSVSSKSGKSSNVKTTGHATESASTNRTESPSTSQKPAVSITAVQAAVKRDRVAQMHELQLTLARIKELREKLVVWHKKAKAEVAKVLPSFLQKILVSSPPTYLPLEPPV
jgi:hypothetical protein